MSIFDLAFLTFEDITACYIIIMIENVMIMIVVKSWRCYLWEFKVSYHICIQYKIHIYVNFVIKPLLFLEKVFSFKFHPVFFILPL